MNTFKILVVEDNELHRQSAQEALVDHEVTIVDSFDKAMELMKEETDKDQVKRLLVEAGFHEKPDSEDQERWNAYWGAWTVAFEKSKIPFPFEVVLTDMMMPMSKKTLAPGVFKANEQVPYGFTIALRATLRGAKFVAMVTDTNHHQGAMSAALDHLGSASYREDQKPNFVINGAQAMFVHAPFRWVKASGPCKDCGGNFIPQPCDWYPDENPHPGGCGKCHGSGKTHCGTCNGSGLAQTGKDWGRVLADLIG